VDDAIEQVEVMGLVEPWEPTALAGKIKFGDLYFGYGKRALFSAIGLVRKFTR